MDFTDKIVLVTGATSGIGNAVARRFSDAGATLVLSGRNEERGEALAGDIRANFIAGDLSDPDFANRLVADTVERHGRLDVLVNNAGIVYRRTVADMTDEEWHDTMAVNVHAVFFLCRAAIPVMRKQGGGVIVNMSSDAAFIGATAMPAYCASKAAVMQMTRAMALDHARENIRINAVCPDMIRTPMLASEARQMGSTPDDYFAAGAEGIPMGRIGEPEEVADAVLYLASERASFVTGAGLLVDGGVTAT
jgi:meso-butanediol dehydrogenase / (S,S)-butanediol dehydrogenase / diacetyl reductase